MGMEGLEIYSPEGGNILLILGEYSEAHPFGKFLHSFRKYSRGHGFNKFPCLFGKYSEAR